MSTIIQALIAYTRTPIGATDTTIPLKYLKDSRGNYITSMPAGASIIYMTLEPRSPVNQESISFTGIQNDGNNQVTLTGVTRNLNPQPPYTTLGGLVPHGNNVEVILSNSAPFYNTFLQTDTDAIITGNYQFPNATQPQNPATLSQLQSAIIAGALDASQSIKGIGKLSVPALTTLGVATMTIATPAVITFANHGLIAGDTVRFTTTGALPTGFSTGIDYYVISSGLTSSTFQLALSNGGTAINTSGSQSGVHTLLKTTPIFVGNDDPRLAPNNYAVSGGSSNAYTMTLASAPTAYISGSQYSFRANFTNTAPATLNINGIGAKSIKKLDGLTVINAGDIANGSIVFVEFNFTLDCFVILNQISQDPFVSVGGSGADGALNVTSGTTTLNAGQVYNFTTFNVSVGATLAFTGNGAIMINVQGAITIAGTIELRYTSSLAVGQYSSIRGVVAGGGSATATVTPNTGGTSNTTTPTPTIGGAGGAGGNSTTSGSGLGGTAGTAGGPSGSPVATAGGTGNGGVSGTGGGGGGGGGGASTNGGANGTAGNAGSGNNGGTGGVGGAGAGASVAGGGGGSGGGGYLTGNGGDGGAGGASIGVSTASKGGNGGNSGATGGNGGAGGTGGAMNSNGNGGQVTGAGGNGGDGFVNGGAGGGAGAPSGAPSPTLGAGGNGGRGRTGTGGAGGAGGTGGNGGNGFNGGAGGAGSSGAGGTGGNSLTGTVPLIILGASTLSFTGTINGQGGNGGNGGNSTGVAGGNGGNASQGADVLMLVTGAVTNTGTVNNAGGTGGTGGTGSVSGTAGKNGRAGTTTIAQLLNF